MGSAVVWHPPAGGDPSANVVRYLDWLRRERGIALHTHEELWTWSVDRLEEFWQSVWEYYRIESATTAGAALPSHALTPTKARIDLMLEEIAR